ncbi:hypothetical protein STEG23_038329 [Scotinomys teguina]
MEVVAAALRCQLLLILLMSVVILLPGTNGSLLLVQRTVTRTIVLQETIGKGFRSHILAPFVVEGFPVSCPVPMALWSCNYSDPNEHIAAYIN